jgi:hypothetical protein
MTNPTSKHNFIQEFDQHGVKVPPDFFDRGEEILIEHFEKVMVGLKSENRYSYSMIELGSNQAYYACLFNAVLREERTKTVLVEPYDPFMLRSVRHFEINNFQAHFDKRSIGDTWEAWQKYKFQHGEVTVDQLMEEYEIERLTVLHSDIDGSELKMLYGASNALKNKLIDHLFILTHSEELHYDCIFELRKYDYEIVYQTDQTIVGTDRLIIAKA